jgi:Uma2 family endonuclease
MTALPDRLLMSPEEYLAWEETQQERHEYWDGEVIAMVGGTNRDCEVYTSDIKTQIRGNLKYFYPDVVVSCDPRDRDDQLVQYPCLIIEVLSPSTESVDRGAKFTYYRKFETLQDYILIQPEQPIVEVFSRNEAGKWVLSDYGLEDVIPLQSLNASIAVKDLYDRITFEPIEYSMNEASDEIDKQ